MENLIFLSNSYTHFLKGTQMQVNGTPSDSTSAGMSQRGFFRSSQQCPQIQYGRTHFPHHFLTDLRFLNIPAVNGQCSSFQFGLAAQFLQNLQRNKHIRNVGHIFQHHFIPGQNGSRKNGQHCVFTASDCVFPTNGSAARHPIISHCFSSRTYQDNFILWRPRFFGAFPHLQGLRLQLI